MAPDSQKGFSFRPRPAVVFLLEYDTLDFLPDDFAYALFHDGVFLVVRVSMNLSPINVPARKIVILGCFIRPANGLHQFIFETLVL